MTGEITLRGNVLAIGGLNEKLLAAKRSGIKNVIIPKENEPELTELSAEVTKGLNIKPVSKMDEVLELAFAESRCE
jgi:ATP-dependent Lon protease